MLLKDLPVFFLDLQTTGARPGNADILEMAWSLSDAEDIHASVVTQPEERPVPRRILSLTGIHADELGNAKDLKSLFDNLYSAAADRIAVIHYAQFEQPFLTDVYTRFELKEFPVLCTHKIAKRLFPNLPAKGIKGLAGYFGHPSGEFKRATCHVEATKVIWKHVLKELESKEILTLPQLQEWLTQAAPKKTKYEYPMAKEKRLGLPAVPGVYRMISQWGEVLYVGKATSLRDRVNSYFRGQKGRDSFKLEMLTQAWDLRVTPCNTPLESALLETDEIKKYNPRYNISLKAGARSLVFFSEDFMSMSETQDEVHTIGPFSSELVFESLFNLNDSLNSEDQCFDENMFYEPIDAQLLKEGFALFCERFSLTLEQMQSRRLMLALGLKFARNYEEELIEEEAEDLSEDARNESNEGCEDLEVPLTAEDLADKYERHFTRAGFAYLRARRLTQLLNSDIEYALTPKGKRFQLFFRDGFQLENKQEVSNKRNPWSTHDVNTYDRMAILLSELTKIENREGFVNISTKLVSLAE